MKNIAGAIKAVMGEVGTINKSLNVGTGGGSYKGVADHEVKETFQPLLAKHGLSILPINVEPTVKISSSVDQHGKTRQSVFTEVKTKYMLLHESGESIELAGYGHGVDSQDKSAGKATTYALKYLLLYTFMVPTKFIDDTDNEHSDSLPVPSKTDDSIPF